MQYRFLRIVFRGRQYSRKALLEKTGVTNLENSRKIHLAGVMYRRASDPEYKDNRQLVTRQFDKKVLKIPDVDLTKTFKSPIYMGSTLWNALPRYVQDCEPYKTFKYHYRQLLG